MKSRRFFLHRQDVRSLEIEGDLGHGLDPLLFGEAIELDEDVRTIYLEAMREATTLITRRHQELSVVEPDLSGNRQMVQCNRYTGGLEICRVYPLADFLAFAPGTIDSLRYEVNACLAPVWQELKSLREMRSYGCVILLKTRFEPKAEPGTEDILDGKLSGIPLYPHAMGYLFHKYSKQNRIMEHNFAIFNGSSEKRVQVEHWKGSEPTLLFDSTGGLSCKVYVPIVV